MAKIEVKINDRDYLLQGDVVVVDWADKTQSVYMVVLTFNERERKTKNSLCNLDGGANLHKFNDIENMRFDELRKRIGTSNNVTIIKKENLHLTIEDMSK